MLLFDSWTCRPLSLTSLKVILVKFVKMIKYICTDLPLHFLVLSKSLAQTLGPQYTFEEEAEAQLFLEESHQPIQLHSKLCYTRHELNYSKCQSCLLSPKKERKRS